MLLKITHCRFVNNILQGRKRKKDLFRRVPVWGTHREIIIGSVPDGKLLLVVIEGVELMVGIEVFVVLAMAALNFTVVPRCKNTNELMPDTKFFKSFLKQCWTDDL